MKESVEAEARNLREEVHKKALESHWVHQGCWISNHNLVHAVIQIF